MEAFNKSDLVRSFALFQKAEKMKIAEMSKKSIIKEFESRGISAQKFEKKKKQEEAMKRVFACMRIRKKLHGNAYGKQETNRRRRKIEEMEIRIKK